MKPRYWSETASREFAALFEDRDYGRAFREQVADALVRGWPPNRDKPLWALVVLVNALAATGRTRGQPSGLELLSLPPDAVLKRLGEHPGGASSPVSVERSGVKVRLVACEASIVVGRTRVTLLRKIAEFLIAADGYRHSREVIATLDAAAAQDLDEAGFREAVRALSRRLYEYRKAHIVEGHAASAFEYVRRTFSDPAKREPGDDDILDLWRAPENTVFVTYRVAFASALDFLRLRREVAERAVVSGPASMDEPAVAATVASPSEAEGEGPAGAASALGFAAIAEGSDHEPLAALAASDLKTFTRGELAFLELVASVWPEGRAYARSVLRLLAFHPIQSAISNSLRTGRARVPLEERVRCVEAETYREIGTRIAALHEKTTNWLAAGYALAAGNDVEGRGAEIREKGLRILSRTRAQSFDRPREELAEAFAEIAEDLVALVRMLDEVQEAIRSVERTRDAASLDETFEIDRAIFAEEFTRRYLADEAAPALLPEPAGNDIGRSLT